MAFKTGANYDFKIDIDKLLVTPVGTPDLQSLCLISAEEALNEVVDTFFKLKDSGFSTSKVVAIDPEFTLAIKYDGDDAASNAILGARYSTSRTTDAEITDATTGETITFVAELTTISLPRTLDAVTEISVTIKPQGSITIA